MLDDNKKFEVNCNQDMVLLESLDDEDVKAVKGLLNKHFEYTKSAVAEKILADWKNYQSKFIKVMPEDYKRVLEAINRAKAEGTSVDDAVMEAAHG